jgi:outer membrane immunogenic protein
MMKRIVGAVMVTAALTAPGFAADLGARSYTKAPALAPVSNWSGFYVGGNLGYGWGNGNTDFSFLPSPADFGENNTSLKARSTGVTGGAQIGYNWQIGSLVTGLEADIQGSGVKGSARATATAFGTAIPDPDFVLSSETKLAWFGTVRGRLGVTVTPDLLLYGTGGLAYGHVDASANTRFSHGESLLEWPASVGKTKAGWTAGAGAEWMFAHNWSAKLEYLYVDLGSGSAIGIAPQVPPQFQVGYTWRTRENIARVGVTTTSTDGVRGRLHELRGKARQAAGLFPENHRGQGICRAWPTLPTRRERALSAVRLRRKRHFSIETASWKLATNAAEEVA